MGEVAPDLLAPRLRELASRSLARAGARAAAASQAALMQVGLSQPQFGLLATLDHAGQLDQAALGERTGLDRSDVAGALARLEQAGAITRDGHAADRRRKVASLTREGRELFAAGTVALETCQRTLLADLSDQERSTLLSLVERVGRSTLSR